jgi:(E)-4-hydroxy-3-methylbut-2-enyl-diphosphate synthase
MFDKYTSFLHEYQRRESIEIKVGNLSIGGKQPIRIQSMTTVDTMDTLGSVEEIIRMVDSGCEIVRLTAPSIKEADNLLNIKKELIKRGCEVPLVADIHFTPNAAEVAARHIEKVRINPGNYVDKKKFEIIEYDDASYAEEIIKIKERFSPLVNICKEYGTAMRIGTNHGSLSDRIVNRYGDTPLGMVESALEFIRVCDEMNYHQLVISMKSSNTQVMIQAYRMLVMRLEKEGLKPYPLHLGVTEAGEGEDGRIKSALGIGTLLEDGLGDTIRVSLTEAPEFEAPIAKILADRYKGRKDHDEIPRTKVLIKDPYSYQKRVTHEVLNFGLENVPRVISDFSDRKLSKEDLKSIGHTYNDLLDKWSMNDLGADYVYLGQYLPPFMLPNGLKAIIDFSICKDNLDDNIIPLMSVDEYVNAIIEGTKLIKVNIHDLTADFLSKLILDKKVILLLSSSNKHAYAELRRVFAFLTEQKITIPVVVSRNYYNIESEAFQLYTATDIGGLLVDGYGDGTLIFNNITSTEKINSITFGTLQASRTRITKTEYISCPSCGRTLFDLQETTAKIRKRTEHLKGLKIGIMGCIVNGPGEMADADFGYVGVGKGKITLYKGQEVVKRGIPEAKALDELINIIKENGRWIEPVYC